MIADVKRKGFNMRHIINPLVPQVAYNVPVSIQDLHETISRLPVEHRDAAFALMCETINYCHSLVDVYVDIVNSRNETVVDASATMCNH